MAGDTATGAANPVPARRGFAARLGPYAYLLPGLAGLVAFIGYPLVFGAGLSLFRGDLVFGTLRWAGLSSYRELLGDSLFHYSLLITLLFTAACVTGTLVLGVAIAFFLNKPFPGRSLVALAVLLPWVMPRVAGTTVWKWMFNDQFGLVNHFLHAVTGLETFRNHVWLNDPLLALAVAALLVIWQSFPFITFAVLAALQGVDRDVLDAASIDGASAWQRVRHIQLPLLQPLLIILLLLSIIWDLKVFDQIWILTKGGPGDKTAILGVYLFKKQIEDIGLAAAMAMVMVLLTFLLSAFYTRKALREA